MAILTSWGVLAYVSGGLALRIGWGPVLTFRDGVSAPSGRPRSGLFSGGLRQGARDALLFGIPSILPAPRGLRTITSKRADVRHTTRTHMARAKKAKPATYRTLDARPNAESLVKPGELVDLVEVTPLTLVDRRIYNQLLEQAWDAIDKPVTHVVAKASLRGSHNSNDRIGESIERLMTAIVRVAVIVRVAHPAALARRVHVALARAVAAPPADWDPSIHCAACPRSARPRVSMPRAGRPHGPWSGPTP